MAMATTLKAARERLSKQRWLARCVELAQQRHVTGTAHYLGTRPSGSHLWKVSSRASDWSAYVVTAWIDGQFSCSCRNGSLYGQPCSHVGAAWHVEQQRQAAERETGPSQEYRWWKNTTAYFGVGHPAVAG